MKRIIAILITAALLLSFAACSLLPFGNADPDAPAADTPSPAGSPSGSSERDNADDRQEIHIPEDAPVSVETAAAAMNTDSETIEELLSQGFVLEDNSYTGPTMEELMEQVFNTEAAYAAAEPSKFSPDLEEMAALQGETVEFSDEPWEAKGVELHDITEHMSPEEKAEWNEFAEMTAEDYEAMVAETEAMIAEFGELDGLVQQEDGSWVMDESAFYGFGGEADGGMSDMPDEDELQQQIDDALAQAQEELEGMELPEGYEDLLGGLDLVSLLEGLY